MKDKEPQWEVVYPEREAARERLQVLATILDAAVRIPGTNIRFGADALLGLIPGIGDAIGAVFSSYILAEAAALGVPKTTLIRMGFNVALEAVFGIIPFAGDIFDIGWKANLRNVRLLNQWIAHPTRTERASRTFVGGLIVTLVAFVIGLGVALTWAVAALIELATGSP